MPDKFNLSHLAQEMVVSRLKGAEDAPAVAAQIARDTIVAGVHGTRSSGQPSEDTVEEICLGIMQGVLLIGSKLPETAVNVLRVMAEAAQAAGLEPSVTMTWAMRGIARMAPLVSVEAQWEIQRAIEEEYQGAGDVFGQFCDAARKK